MVLVVEVAASTCGLITLDAVRSREADAAGALAGIMIGALVDSTAPTFQSMNPVPNRVPVAPMDRQRITTSLIQERLVWEFTRVIAGELTIAVPLASAPVPHK